MMEDGNGIRLAPMEPLRFPIFVFTCNLCILLECNAGSMLKYE